MSIEQINNHWQNIHIERAIDYFRLICEDCANEITNYHKTTFSEIILRKEDK